MSKPQQQKILCAVGGMIRPGAMCGAVIVGLKYCGHTGNCQHQIKPLAEKNKEKS